MTDFFDVLMNRTMVRSFSNADVDPMHIKKIIDAGIRAPTAGGNEQWAFIIVADGAKRVKMRELLIQAQAAYYAEMMKVPWSREKLEKWRANINPDLYRAPFYVAVFTDLHQRAYTIEEIELLWAHQSSAAAIENMLLAACALGLGGCWFGVPLLMEAEFLSLLGIVDNSMKLSAVLAIGYPKEKTMPKKRAKAYDAIVKTI